MICGRGEGLTVIEDQKDMAAAAEAAGATVIVGDATKESILRQAGLDAASTLLIAIPEGVEAGPIVRRARAINPKPVMLPRAHSGEEVARQRYGSGKRVAVRVDPGGRRDI